LSKKWRLAPWQSSESVPGHRYGSSYKIEGEEDGDGDSNCSADEEGKLFSSVLKSASDRREIVVLEDNDDILCDTPHNMIEVKRGLAPEVKVSAPPANWVPDRVKFEYTEPASFLLLITLWWVGRIHVLSYIP
jgi:hypothetical protein